MLQDREQLNTWMHHSMAVTGGYLGVYALMCRNDFFGNALTSNLIYIVTGILGTNFFEVIIRIIGALLYVSGIACTILLSKKYHKNLHPFSLLVDFCAIVILGCLPEQMNPILSLYPIFFAMAFQWNSFPGAYGYNCSCIFSTNNSRQVANALTEYTITHDKKQLHKAWFFGGTLICFHIGVAFSWITHRFIGLRSVWLCLLPLFFSSVLVYHEYRLEKSGKLQKAAVNA